MAQKVPGQSQRKGASCAGVLSTSFAKQVDVAIHQWPLPPPAPEDSGALKEWHRPGTHGIATN
jgi:hypothetical protein